MSDDLLIAPQLWLLSTKTASKQLEKNSLNQLQPNGIARYNAIFSAKKQRQFLLGRWLITYALSQVFAQPTRYWLISENAEHGPTIDNLPKGYYFSLSHCQDVVVFTLSTAPIGIDIEEKKVRSNLTTLATAFMTPAELQHYCLEKDPFLFYHYWCLKEAFYKSMAPAAQRTIRLHTISAIELLQSHAGHVLEFLSETYQLTLFNNQVIQHVDCFKLSRDITEGFQQTTKGITTTWTSLNIVENQ